MQEVLSKTDDPMTSLRDQEFYELRLYDSDSGVEPVYCLREAIARWDVESSQPVWDQLHNENFPTLKAAKERYAERRFALAQRGFIYSDMDLF